MITNIIFQKNIFRLIYRVFRWHFRYLAFREVSPLACGFYFTSKCNFRCEFCNIWRLAPGFQVSESEAKRIIRELGDLGLIYFSFSGGEPLLIPYIFDLLAYAKECGILYTHIVSNGYLMDESKAKKLAMANLSEISFSIDGPEEIHDSLRGVRGAFSKVLEAVHHVRTHAPFTKIVLNTILNPAHPENALSAVETATNIGVKIKIQPINNHPSFNIENAADKTLRCLQKDQKEKLLDIISRLQRSSSVVNSKPFLENYKAFLFDPDAVIFSRDNCIFGYHHIELFNSQIFPCLEGLNWENGFSISGSCIKKITSSQSYHKKLQQLKKCSFCLKNYYVCYYEPRLNFPIWNFLKSRSNFATTNFNNE